MKRLVILVLAVVLVFSAVLGTSLAVGSTQEQLTHEETVLYGDPAASDGLSLSLRYTYNGYLQWFSQYRFGSPDTCRTDFRCYTVEPDFTQRAVDYRGVCMHTAGSYFSMDHLSDLFRMELANGNTDPYPGLLGAYQKLYKETPEGELNNTYIRIGDYCDYYPLAGTMELPGGGYHWNFYSGSGYLVNGKEAAQALNDYFRIPVLEDDWMQVVVDKRSGNVMEAVDISYPRKGEDWYELDSVGICHGNRAYFTIDPLTEKGAVVDTSLIPGGYGLYSVDYDDSGKVNFSTLSTRLSLDPAYEPVDMTVDEEFGNLHYFSSRDDCMYLTVIDLDTMEILQNICIHQGREGSWQYYKQLDNAIVAVEDDERLAVWQKNDQGLYTYCFTAEIPEEERAFGLYDARFAFDGERLAIVNREGKQLEAYEHIYTHILCGWSLSIYTEQGCVYRGIYTSSLEPEDPNREDEACRLMDIQVVWE